MRLLRYAKELGGRLVVGLNSDRIGGKAVHVPEELRMESIRSNSWVDEVLVIDEPLNLLLDRLRPEIVVKGKEYEELYNGDWITPNQVVFDVKSVIQSDKVLSL